MLFNKRVCLIVFIILFSEQVLFSQVTQQSIDTADLNLKQDFRIDHFIDAIELKQLDAKIGVVLANKECYALERAKKHNIKAVFVDPKAKNGEEYDKELAKELNDIHYLWTVQYRLGQIFLKLGQEEQALTYFQISIATLEQMRNYLKVPELRQLFMQRNLNPYREMIRLLLKHEKHKEALLYLERFKARTFLEMVAYGEPQLHHVPELIREALWLRSITTRPKALSKWIWKSATKTSPTELPWRSKVRTPTLL